MSERLLRALAVFTAGAAIALDHLRDRTTPEPEAEIRIAPEPLAFPCPMCPGSLRDGPHFHGEDAFWATEHAGTILLTDLSGGDPLVIGGAE